MDARVAHVGFPKAGRWVVLKFQSDIHYQVLLIDHGKQLHPGGRMATI